jgi:hypothetical protein
VGSEKVNPKFFLVFKSLIEKFAKLDFSQVVQLFGLRTTIIKK